MPGLFTHPGCAPSQAVAAGQTLGLTTPVRQGGVTVFRSTVYVRVPLDARCLAVRLAPTSQLIVRFDPVTVRVEPGDQAWIEEWSRESEAANVRMRYPAPISKLYSSTHREVALHRVDGAAVSDEATVVVAIGATLSHPFVGADFRAELSKPAPDLVASLAADTIAGIHQPVAMIMSLAAGPASGPAVTHTSVRNEPAIRRALASGALTAFDVRGLPGTPRLRLFDEAHEESLWQWLEPGEHATPVSFSASGADLAGLLQPALDRAFEQRHRHNDGLPQDQKDYSPIVLPLEIESDAPCSVVVSAPTLVFLLEAELLTGPVALAFVGGADQTARAVLDPPAGTRASVHIEATVAQREAAPLDEPPPLPPGARQGVHLESGNQAAAPWQAERPYWLCGLAFGWYALSERTVLSAAVFADAAGEPTAQPIAESRIDVAASSPGWVRGRWPDVPVQPGAYWLRLRADEGFGVWLGAPASTARKVWLQTPPAKGVATMLPVDLMVVPLEGGGAVEPSVPPVGLSLNGHALELSSPRAGAVSADLGATAALVPPAPWSLDATSAHELTLTLQSVRLRYQQ